MPVPEDGYPIELRDELFKLWRSCLGVSDGEARFKKGLDGVSRRAKGSWIKGAYLDDRVPRYLQALRDVAALPELPGPFAREVRVGRILFNQGLFFDCHEYLEAFWKETSGDYKRSLQGLIMAGAGFHKLEQGSSSGCAHLLKEASAKLARASGPGLVAFGLAVARSAEAADRGDLQVEQAPQLAAEGLEL